MGNNMEFTCHFVLYAMCCFPSGLREAEIQQVTKYTRGNNRQLKILDGSTGIVANLKTPLCSSLIAITQLCLPNSSFK
jgi:hypothetical protein